MNRKLIPAAAVATCAAAVLALFAGPVNADDAPGPVPVPSTSPTTAPSVPPTPRPATPPGTSAPGTPTPRPTVAPQPGTTRTGSPGGGTGDATPTRRPTGSPTPAPGCARPVPQLSTPEGVPGQATVTVDLCATDARTGRGRLVFTSAQDTDGPLTYRVTLRWTYEGKPEAGCTGCWSSARYDYTEDVYVNDAVHAEPVGVPFVLRHRGELIGEQRPGTGVTVVGIEPVEVSREDNPRFVGPVPGATEPAASS
ncbi:hypothetical protein [Streptomyces yangpuensis]|uniref:hypothetical protein n=1 Tax=Streptomyces yangpuensis TaxID=1648182 RepID=UPI0038260649